MSDKKKARLKLDPMVAHLGEEFTTDQLEKVQKNVFDPLMQRRRWEEDNLKIEIKNLKNDVKVMEMLFEHQNGNISIQEMTKRLKVI